MNVYNFFSNNVLIRTSRFFLTIAIIAFLTQPVLLSQSSPQTVNLGTSGDFVILAKTGISTTGTTQITGDLGVSPAAASFITGFGLILDPSSTYSTSSLVNGKIYAADYLTPTPTKMTTAIGDMETAYTDAAGRTIPDYTELHNGILTGKTLTPGLYNWSTGVVVASGGVTIAGGATDIWIFQIAQNLELGNGAIVTLSGGAQASNIFWQVAGQVTLGTTSAMKGIILCKTQIALHTGASLNGKALAQTAVTSDANSITNPVLSAIGNEVIPQKFALRQNFPNPFNPSTVIQYSIEKSAKVSLKIYNLLGMELFTLVNSRQEAGSYSVTFNTNSVGKGFLSGVYFYRLEAGSLVSTKKLIYMK
jgi:hypothetical protein